MWDSRITIPFLWIEFVNPCAKGECFWIKTKGFFWFVCFFLLHQVLKIIPYFVFLSYLSHDFLFLYNCFILSEISKITFLFLGSCALLFQLFPSCHSYFLEPSLPPALFNLLVAGVLRSYHPRILLHCSTGVGFTISGIPCLLSCFVPSTSNF